MDEFLNDLKRQSESNPDNFQLRLQLIHKELRMGQTVKAYVVGYASLEDSDLTRVKTRIFLSESDVCDYIYKFITKAWKSLVASGIASEDDEFIKQLQECAAKVKAHNMVGMRAYNHLCPNVPIFIDETVISGQVAEEDIQ